LKLQKNVDWPSEQVTLNLTQTLTLTLTLTLNPSAISSRTELQKIIARLNETCKDYGMEKITQQQKRWLSVRK